MLGGFECGDPFSLLQAKLAAYGEEQRAILTENGALREVARAARERFEVISTEAEALRNQARIALQLSDLRSQQVTDMTAMHAAEIAELQGLLAAARATEEASKKQASEGGTGATQRRCAQRHPLHRLPLSPQLEAYRLKLDELGGILTEELTKFKAFRSDTGRQVEKLGAAAKAAEKARGAATMRALEAEIALAQAHAEARDLAAKHAAQISTLSRLPKALAAERAVAREAMARARAVVRAALVADGGDASAPSPPVLRLDAAATSELLALLSSAGDAAAVGDATESGGPEPTAAVDAASTGGELAVGGESDAAARESAHDAASGLLRDPAGVAEAHPTCADLRDGSAGLGTAADGDGRTSLSESDAAVPAAVGATVTPPVSESVSGGCEGDAAAAT